MITETGWKILLYVKNYVPPLEVGQTWADWFYIDPSYLLTKCIQQN